jgi:hypothetical protein
MRSMPETCVAMAIGEREVNTTRGIGGRLKLHSHRLRWFCRRWVCLKFQAQTIIWHGASLSHTGGCLFHLHAEFGIAD